MLHARLVFLWNKKYFHADESCILLHTVPQSLCVLFTLMPNYQLCLLIPLKYHYNSLLFACLWHGLVCYALHIQYPYLYSGWWYTVQYICTLLVHLYALHWVDIDRMFYSLLYISCTNTYQVDRAHSLVLCFIYI